MRCRYIYTFFTLLFMVCESVFELFNSLFTIRSHPKVLASVGIEVNFVGDEKEILNLEIRFFGVFA